VIVDTIGKRLILLDEKKYNNNNVRLARDSALLTCACAGRYVPSFKAAPSD